MHFKSSNFTIRPMNVYISENLIDEVKFINYLGLTIQSNLKYNRHIDKVVGKVSRYGGCFFALKGILPLKVLRSLYFAFIYPHLTLHVLAWGEAQPSILHSLEVAQNKAVLNITGMTSASTSYSDLEILRFSNVYKLRLVLFIFKQLNNNGIFAPLVLQHNWSHSHDTRRGDSLRLPFSRNSVTHSFCLFQGLRLWNSIPSCFKCVTSLNRCKTSYQKYLQESQNGPAE